MAERFVRPDVRAFPDYVNGLPGPQTHELGAVAAGAVGARSRSLAKLRTGPLAVRRDLACPGGDIALRLSDARAERGPGPMIAEAEANRQMAEAA